MEPSETTHPDPFGQALTAGGQKIAELAAVATLAGQVAAQARARKQAQAADGGAEWETQLAEARARWALALDPGRLSRANLLDTVRAWAAAAPWEHAAAGASDALDAAEGHMRELHPYAMGRYDARRAEGMTRADAMRASVPDFAMHPSPRPMPADTRQDRGQAALPAAPAPGLTESDAHILRDVLAAIARLSDRAAAAGRGPLDPEIARAALAGVPAVPPGLADRVAEGMRSGAITVAAPAPGPATAADIGPAALNWPHGVHDAVAATDLRRSARGRRRAPARRASQHTRTRQPHPPAL
jgi:hypothetical protein